MLRPRYGALAQAIYAIVGAVGAPVFAHFSGGLGVVLGPTGGYLLSYPLAAARAGLAAHTAANTTRRTALWASLVQGCAGLATIYALGATWLAVVTQLPFAVALAQGVLPFVPFDLIKVAFAALVAIAAAPVSASSRA